MSWLLLSIAILFEVIGTTSMKLSEGFSKLIPSIMMALFYMLSFTAFNFALKKLDISIAYAVWSGIGTVAISIIGAIFFKEQFNATKVSAIMLIIIGTVMLNMNGISH